jgi:hypothetical protein
VRGQYLLLAVLLVGGAAFAGCASQAPQKAKSDDAPTLEVSATTGGIRGLVVDQAVVPVPGATITISGGKNTTSDAKGLFNFTGLEPGDYFLQVVKPGFKSIQVQATVAAGVADPPIVKVLLERLSTAQPYLDFFKLDGFYQCASSVSFDVDTCDWVYRTGWDQYNESAPSPAPKPLPAPRSAFTYTNTQYIDVPADTYSIVQEGFWTDESIKVFWIMIDEAPIKASCDCSDSFGGKIMGNPEYQRIDRFKADGTNNTGPWTEDGFGSVSKEGFPAGRTVVSRGFLAPANTPVTDSTDATTWYAVAQNFKFQVITSLFHNYVAPQGWTFETQANYKVG